MNIYHVERWHEVKGGQVFFSPGATEASSGSMPREYDFLPAMQRHPWPIHLIEGDPDFGSVTVELTRRWSAKLPNTRLTVIEKAGHKPWIDAPDEFRKAPAQALASVA